MIGGVIHVLDLLIAIAVAGAIYIGFRTGAIRQVFGFAGVIVAFVAGYLYMHPAGDVVVSILNIGYSIAPLMGFIAIFALVQLTFVAAIRVLEGIFGVLKLTVLNRLAGGALAAGKAVLLLSIVFLALGTVDIPEPEARTGSVLYEPVASALPSAWSYVSSEVLTTEEFVEAFRMQLERRVADRS